MASVSILAYGGIRDRITHTPINTDYFYEQPVAILIPAPVAYSITVINNENQEASVMPVYSSEHTPYNGVQRVAYEDILSSSVSVPANSSNILTFPFASNPYNIIALEVGYATAPTSGVFTAYLTVY